MAHTHVMYRFIVLTLGLLAGLFLWSDLTHAQGSGSIPAAPETPLSVYDYNAQGIDVELKSHNKDLLGDMISTDTGALSFRQVDVSIPGNSHLKVEFARFLDGDKERRGHFGTKFGGNPWGSGWAVDLPYFITRTHKDGKWTPCLESSDDIGISEVGAMGLKFYSSGGNGQQLIHPHSSIHTNFDSKWITKDNWKVDCSEDNSSSGYLIATAPNGDVYKFEKIYTYKDRFYSDPDGYQSHELENHVAYVTEVQDIYDNWVRYEYNDVGPTRIHSNDLRDITINYETLDSGKRISSVFANSRTWTYSYSNINYLKKVTLPDSRFWEFSMLRGVNYGAQRGVTGGSGSNPINYRTGPCFFDEDSENRVKHPDGTVGYFDMQKIVNFRIGLNGLRSSPPSSRAQCKPWKLYIDDKIPRNQYRPPYDNLATFFTSAVVEKKLVLPTGTEYIWSYEYQDGDKYNDDDSEPLIVGDSDSITSRIGCPFPTQCSFYEPYKKRTINHPNGSRVEVYYSFDVDTEGELIKREFFADEISTTAIKTEVFETEYHELHGSTKVPNGNYGRGHNRDIAVTKFLIKEIKIFQDSDTYTTEHEYNTDQSSPDYSFGYPTQTKTYSDLAGYTEANARVTDVTYIHDTYNWILGLTDKVHVNGVEYVDNDYGTSGGALGQVTNVKRLGLTDYQTLTYNADGTVDTVTDAIGRVSQASNWKRGTPQTIKKAVGSPDEITITQTIDDNGLVEDSTDARGKTTNYDYDVMGRLTKIDPPGNYFDSTYIAYDFTGGGAVQTITKGSSETRIEYDGLLRPILETTKALDTSWEANVVTEYDLNGQVGFKSFPSSGYSVLGTFYQYDRLGRITEEFVSGSPYSLTRYAYLSGNRTRTTDPGGHISYTYRDGYSGPGKGDVIQINQSANNLNDIRTYINRDDLGLITSVRQSGETGGVYVNKEQDFLYDGQQRLCYAYTPSGGGQYFAYNDADELIAQSKSHGVYSGSTCPSPSGAYLQTHSYDDLGRLIYTDYAHAGTADVGREYDDNGNLTALYQEDNNEDEIPWYDDDKRVAWTYAYDDLNHLELEKLWLDKRKFEFNYVYDQSGSLESQTREYQMDNWQAAGTSYYHGIDYMRDGLGRGLSLDLNGTPLASGADYHESGALKGLSYGNGQLFSANFNSRQQPRRLLTHGGGETALDLNYTYNARGLVETLIDGTDANNNRTYGYDGAGRLTSATGPWGNGTFTYDSLGNILDKSLGSRSITMSYNSRNRLETVMDTGATGTRSLTYDNRGHVRTVGGLTMNYNAADRPTGLSGDVQGSHRYDGYGRRVKSIKQTPTGSVVRYNVYDSTGSLAYVVQHDHSDENDDYVMSYVNLDATTSARVKSVGNQVNYTDSVTYLHKDHLGSASSGTDDLGHVIWTESYTPFGIALSPDAANDNQAAFTGHIRDSDTGLTYMQARYYDPVASRFLSIDPVTFGQTGDPRYFNRYAYAGNDPINNLDPDGRIIGKVIKFARNTYKAKGNPIKGAADTLAGIGEDLGTLTDGQLNLDDVGAVVSLVTGLDKKDQKAIGGAAKRVHGNCKSCTKPQHRYEISDQTGDVKKTGISGQPLNKNGTSPRANSQVNKLNNSGDGNTYSATVPESNIPGRTAGMDAEQAATNRLSEQGHSLELQKRPKPD